MLAYTTKRPFFVIFFLNTSRCIQTSIHNNTFLLEDPNHTMVFMQSVIRKNLTYATVCCVGGAVGYYRFQSSEQASFDSFPDFTEHFNLMSQHLTKSMYRNLRDMRTPSDFSLDRCIQPGVDLKGNVYSKRDPGIVAGDEECYTAFSDIFGAVAKEFFGVRDHKKALDSLQNMTVELDPAYVMKVTVTAVRNIPDFPYSPSITRGQRERLSEEVMPALTALPADLAGPSRLIVDCTKAEMDALAEAEANYAKPLDDFDIIAGVTRDWPDERRISLNASKNFYTLLNGRHHIEMGTVERNGKIGAVCSGGVGRGEGCSEISEGGRFHNWLVSAL